MSKLPKRGRNSVGTVKTKPPRKLKLFRPVDWYEGPSSEGPTRYISHLLTELGRLDLAVHKIEDHGRAPHTQCVLSDLLKWLDADQNPLAPLMDWRFLDMGTMGARLEKNRDAKPRIEISAVITKMNNLSVRWHPGGWRRAQMDWDRRDHYTSNLIAQRKWRERPDFRWFEGDQETTFKSRASNEIMYIRGVGKLYPNPREIYGDHAIYNTDVLHSILICAVRSAYENLIGRLEDNFEVEVLNNFDFQTIEENDENSYFPIKRVVAWSLEDAVELEARRKAAREAETERHERAELAEVERRFGFTVDAFISALIKASGVTRRGEEPSAEDANRAAAKALRIAGFSVDAGKVRRIRQLLERYAPEKLPDGLRPVPTDSAPSIASAAENVIFFKPVDAER